MMSELACAGGLVIMNGKGAVRSTVGLAIAFVAYTILLGIWAPFSSSRQKLKFFLDTSQVFPKVSPVKAAFHIKTPHYPYYIAQLF